MAFSRLRAAGNGSSWEIEEDMKSNDDCECVSV